MSYCVGGLVLAVLLKLVLSRNFHLTGEHSVHTLFPVRRGLVFRRACAPEKVDVKHKGVNRALN